MTPPSAIPPKDGADGREMVGIATLILGGEGRVTFGSERVDFFVLALRGCLTLALAKMYPSVTLQTTNARIVRRRSFL